MSGHARWQLVGAQATLGFERFAAHLDVANPATGLGQFSVDGIQVDPRMRIFAVCPPEGGQSAPVRLRESYLRGRDLVATYWESDASRFRIEIYWRDVTDQYSGALAAVELVLSLQTSLLDSQPRLTVSSLLPAAAVWRSAVDGPGSVAEQPLECPPDAVREFTAADGAGCFRFSIHSSGCDYVELVHPADFEWSSLRAARATEGPGTMLLTHRLFEQRLEKGVILRSRLLGLFLPSGTAGGLVADCYRKFAGEKLPLSA